jgi:hypothetical protein
LLRQKKLPCTILDRIGLFLGFHSHNQRKLGPG